MAKLDEQSIAALRQIVPAHMTWKENNQESSSKQRATIQCYIGSGAWITAGLDFTRRCFWAGHSYDKHGLRRPRPYKGQKWRNDLVHDALTWIEHQTRLTHAAWGQL